MVVKMLYPIAPCIGHWLKAARFRFVASDAPSDSVAASIAERSDCPSVPTYGTAQSEKIVQNR